MLSPSVFPLFLANCAPRRLRSCISPQRTEHSLGITKATRFSGMEFFTVISNGTLSMIFKQSKIKLRISLRPVFHLRLKSPLVDEAFLARSEFLYQPRKQFGIKIFNCNFHTFSKWTFMERTCLAKLLAGLKRRKLRLIFTFLFEEPCKESESFSRCPKKKN